MKEIIKHFVQNNQLDLEKSLFNCHTIGLHSIMLLDSPGKTIRLYIADENHQLYRNDTSFIFKNLPMSIGFHTHHCDLTIQCVRGKLMNWTVEEFENGYLLMDKYLYQSHILEGQIKFQKLNQVKLHTKAICVLGEDSNALILKSQDIHTVYCMPNEVCAWLVYEGQEDPQYQPYCYSNADLNTTTNSDLYKKPSLEEILGLLEKVDLI